MNIVLGRRPVVRLLVAVVVVNAAIWGDRYFADPTVGQVGAKTNQVTIAASALSPAVVEVAGSEVTWTLADTQGTTWSSMGSAPMWS